MKSSLFICTASIITLTACASSGYPITYNSLPQGATLVCGNSVMGTTPYTGYRSVANLEGLADIKRRREKLLQDFRARGAPEHVMEEARVKLRADDCRAVWASGATALYDYVDADTAKTLPNGLDLLVSHPGDASTRIDDARTVQAQQPLLPQQQVQLQQQPAPVYQPAPLPAMPETSFPSAPGRTTTVCRTLSNGTIVCN